MTQRSIELAVDELLTRLIVLDAPSALNIYNEQASVAVGDEPGEATKRLNRLRSYLLAHWKAPIALIGEAPGKHGARLSGVPFTSLRILTGTGPSEQTATIVHQTLSSLGVADQVILWNVSVLFRSDNRDPLPDAIDASADLLRLVTRGRTVYAIGRYAQRSVGVPGVRHPANGGAPLFRAGMETIFRSPPGTDIVAGLAGIWESPITRGQSSEPKRVNRSPSRAAHCPGCHLQLPTSGVCGSCP